MQVCGLHSTGAQHEQVVSSYEYDNEPLGYTEGGEFLY
jgi:hypothetical protein